MKEKVVTIFTRKIMATQNVVRMAMLMVSALAMSVPVFCDGLFESAESAAGEATTSVISLALAVMPLAIAVVGVLLIITHDEKRIGQLKGILKTLLIAFLVLWVANNFSAVVETINTWLGGTEFETGALYRTIC